MRGGKSTALPASTRIPPLGTIVSTMVHTGCTHGVIQLQEARRLPAARYGRSCAGSVRAAGVGTQRLGNVALFAPTRRNFVIHCSLGRRPSPIGLVIAYPTSMEFKSVPNSGLCELPHPQSRPPARIQRHPAGARTPRISRRTIAASPKRWLRFFERARSFCVRR
jgi:hypothetical protein